MSGLLPYIAKWLAVRSHRIRALQGCSDSSIRPNLLGRILRLSPRCSGYSEAHRVSQGCDCEAHADRNTNDKTFKCHPVG